LPGRDRFNVVVAWLISVTTPLRADGWVACVVTRHTLVTCAAAS